MSNLNLPHPTKRAFYEQLKLFGDAWTLIIVCELLASSYRFNELHRRVGSISPVTLTSRLKRLEQLGIITRTVKIQDQLSVSYCITDKGRGLEPVLVAIHDFAETHYGVSSTQEESTILSRTAPQ